MLLTHAIADAGVAYMSIAQWVAHWLRLLHSTMVRALRRAAGDVLAAGPLPQHVAFVMDGNRRFADRLRMPVDAGHQHGYSKVGSVCRPEPTAKSVHFHCVAYEAACPCRHHVT